MLSAIIAIVISLSIGGVLWYLTHRSDSITTISSKEFLIGSAISVVALLIAGPVIEHLIISNQLKYYEYYNGYETAAVQSAITCERDGSCNDDYNCDPYTVQVSHTYEDSDGDEHTYYTTETRYHHCPYVNTEYTFTIVTTLGNYPVGGQYALDRTPWRAGVGVPADVPQGPPAEWIAARDRINAGKNGGVTEVKPYQNFLLASDKTLLDQYSDSIALYQKKGLMPDHTLNYSNSIYGMYSADKFVGVGGHWNGTAFNEYLQRFNGYFGYQLQGDVHMVAIDAKLISNPDDYAQAVFANWKSATAYGKYAFPKNAIGIIVGVKDDKITWARTTTGLPVGNEALMLDIQNGLKGVAFTPDDLIGIPQQRTGALYKELYGTHKYSRPHNRDYKYLSADVSVSGWQRFWIVLITTLLSGSMWFAFLMVDDRVRKLYDPYNHPFRGDY